jgi:aspartate carbamoyltransferase
MASLSLFKQHIISAKLFTRELLELLLADSVFLQEAIEKTGKLDLLKGKTIALLFCEPSTRTCTSFQTAALKLGADVLPIDFNNSSAKKNETMQDTLRTLEQFSDAIVMRHPEKDIHKKMIPYLSHPILNAGDGSGEHPTQALLDLYTIYKEFNRLDGLNITLLGDLKHGRTVHSLFQLLSRFDGITVNLVSPKELAFPQEYIDSVVQEKGSKIKFNVIEELDDEVFKNTDVLYVTRLQRERFAKPEEFDKIKSGYNIDKKTVDRLKQTAIVMHPLPRVDELDESVDSDPRARYFRQIYLGTFARAALLWNVLGKK